MGQLVASLVPLALGIVMSPLAVMALVAVLVSRRGRANGAAYLIGWVVGILVVLVVFLAVFSGLTAQDRQEPPTWVAVVRLLVASLLILGGIYTHRRGAAQKAKMAEARSPSQVVAAAPQLPGWLRAVESFTPARTFLLGVGIFVLNPVDLSCAVLAAMDIQLADIGTAATIVTTVVFAMIGIAPIAVPVVYTLTQGPAADPLLRRMRTWIAEHSTDLNAGLLVFVGALQLQKALSALL